MDGKQEAEPNPDHHLLPKKINQSDGEFILFMITMQYWNSVRSAFILAESEEVLPCLYCQTDVNLHPVPCALPAQILQGSLSG